MDWTAPATSDDFHAALAAGVVYLPDEARFSHLLTLPDGTNVGQSVNEAMHANEKENPDLADVLPKAATSLGGASLIPRAAPAACSSSPPASWRSTTATPTPRF